MWILFILGGTHITESFKFTLQTPFSGHFPNYFIGFLTFIILFFFPPKRVKIKMAFSTFLFPHLRRDDKDVQHLGICERFFSFFMNSLVGCSLKRVTTGHPLSDHESVDIPVEHSAKPAPNHGGEGSGLHIDRSSSEIKVIFGHTNGLEHGVPTKDNPPVKEEKGNFRVERLTRATARVPEKLTPPPAGVEDKTVELPQRAIVMNGINERSEKFIAKKREDLAKTDNLD